MKKIKYLLLTQLIASSSVIAHAQEIKDNPCDCRFKTHDVVMVTKYDEDPALVGQVGTILTDCNPAKYHLVNIPKMGGSWEILDDDMGLANQQ